MPRGVSTGAKWKKSKEGGQDEGFSNVVASRWPPGSAVRSPPLRYARQTDSGGNPKGLTKTSGVKMGVEEGRGKEKGEKKPISTNCDVEKDTQCGQLQILVTDEAE